MAAAVRAEVLGSYRYVLRAIKDTFAGDGEAIAKSVFAARAEYRKNVAVRDDAAVKKMVHDARDAADFLRASIVQAKLNSQGRYEMKLQSPEQSKPEHIDVQDVASASRKEQAPKDGCCGGGCH